MEKCFLCLPRANDYLTNITIVTQLFLIFFQIANETLLHFQDEMFLLVHSVTALKFHHFLQCKFTFLGHRSGSAAIFSSGKQ